MIELHGIEVVFNKGRPTATTALSGVDLAIPQEQFVTVIGSNGAGKSTLLNAISGDVLPTQGKIVIGDTDVSDWATEQRAKLVARVFQDPMGGTCADLTIEENLALARHRGDQVSLSRAVTRRLQDDFREHLSVLGLGLEDRLKDKMSLLSGGQRQAVTLVMASLAPTEVLLLDEHAAALDPKTADFVMHLTEEIIARKRLTCLMVTHSMRHALDYGSRVIMMHQGRIVFDVSGEERVGLEVADLLTMFERVRGEKLVDDRLLLES